MNELKEERELCAGIVLSLWYLNWTKRSIEMRCRNRFRHCLVYALYYEIHTQYTCFAKYLSVSHLSFFLLYFFVFEPKLSRALNEQKHTHIKWIDWCRLKRAQNLIRLYVNCAWGKTHSSSCISSKQASECVVCMFALLDI